MSNPVTVVGYYSPTSTAQFTYPNPNSPEEPKATDLGNFNEAYHRFRGTVSETVIPDSATYYTADPTWPDSAILPPPLPTDPRLTPVLSAQQTVIAGEVLSLLARKAMVAQAKIAYPALVAAFTAEEAAINVRLAELTT